MKVTCSIVGYFFLQACFCMSDCNRQVTFACNKNNDITMKGEPGLVGKQGPVGIPGPAGPMGNETDLTDLEEKIRELNQSLMKIRRKYLPSIFHFQLPASQITWSGCKRHCIKLGLVLCSHREIFPREGLMRSIGTQTGDHWVPIRDSVNNWVEVGTSQGRSQPPGAIHNNIWGPPNWGSQGVYRHYKGHFFCCLH